MNITVRCISISTKKTTLIGFESEAQSGEQSHI